MKAEVTSKQFRAYNFDENTDEAGEPNAPHVGDDNFEVEGDKDEVFSKTIEYLKRINGSN